MDVIDDATEHVGDTNFMAVDRDNVLETTFDELRSVEDPRITFQVSFMVSRLKILEVQEKSESGFSTNRSRQNILIMDLRNT